MNFELSVCRVAQSTEEKQINYKNLTACHECDLIHNLKEIPPGGAALCRRCGCSLHRSKRDSLSRTLALTLAGGILFLIANTHPFLGFKVGSQLRETTLATGIYELYMQDMFMLATLVLFTVILVPAIHLGSLLYIVIPLGKNRVPKHLVKVFKLYLLVKPWGMMEIFLLGIFVSAIKLVKMATIIPGVALYAFLALIFIFAAISAVLDEHLIWKKVGIT